MIRHWLICRLLHGRRQLPLLAILFGFGSGAAFLIGVYLAAQPDEAHLSGRLLSLSLLVSWSAFATALLFGGQKLTASLVEIVDANMGCDCRSDNERMEEIL